MAAKTFRQITICGDPEQRGISYGEQLAPEILRTVDVYRQLLPLTGDEMLSRGKQLRHYLIDRPQSRDFTREIDGIAVGVRRRTDPEFDVGWLYALNARTELLELAANECTSVYFRDTARIGQNWDWVESLEELAVFLTIVPDDGPTIWMLTEPGMIGKIGMNSAGIGVCLNFLRCRQAAQPGLGLPIHLVLRSVLNASSLTEARRAIEEESIQTASNILAGDSSGACFDVEFAGSDAHWLQCADPATLHTNHYCLDGTPLNNGFEETLASSFNRYRRATALATNLASFSLQEMNDLLSDREGDLPINRDYEPSADFPAEHKIGTVATLLMDLRERRLLLRRGPATGNSAYVEMPLPCLSH